MDNITHKEIYERLVQVEANLAKVETKVDGVDAKTAEVVKAFDAAKGAFLVLEFIGKIAKPILWFAGVTSAISFLISEYWKRW